MSWQETYKKTQTSIARRWELLILRNLTKHYKLSILARVNNSAPW